MADHRANDLSYGHLGEATYDADENQWGFSADPSHSHTFQQILPFTKTQQSYINDSREPIEKYIGNAAREQRRWLSKARPETFPANFISSTYSRDSSNIQAESSVPAGQLLAVGGAVDVSRMPAYRTEPIIAMPCGEAGNILRLLKPRVENYGWGIQSSVRLPLMDASIAEHGHWVGTGGRIQQVTFADDGKSSSTWLAIRQFSMITFFRPIYHISPVSAIKPDIFEVSFPPSKICANPVAVLNAQQNGSKILIDVSFNPYYARQFAVIDDAGSWSTWDIEGRKKLNLIVGKRGTMKDESIIGSPSKLPVNADGWHHILWVANVSTIAVCDRRSLVLFDITAMPRRLRSCNLLPSNSTDWILDMKRSAIHSNHLYILTSSRIFWLEVVAVGEARKPDSPGAKLILSYRHYRDSNDNTMKLVVLKDDDVSALIVSSKSSLINYYKFSMDIAGPASWRGSLITRYHTSSIELQSLLFLQAPLIPRSSRAPGPEFDYVERGVRFYQAWFLASNLETGSTLYAVHDLNISNGTNQMYCITAPTRKILDARRREAVERIKSHFIVPDGDLDEDQNASNEPLSTHASTSGIGMRDPLRLCINWIEIYRRVFSTHEDSSETEIFNKHLKTVISDHVQKGKDRNHAPMTTLLELSQLPMFSKDLEQVNLDDFWDEILNEDDINTPFTLVLSNLSLSADSKALLSDDPKLPNFIHVYDRLVGQWIQSLPREISNQARLSIFNITRKVAVELCLSSIAVSFCDRTADREKVNTEVEEVVLPTSETKEGYKEASQSIPSSQITAESLHDARFGLPTPAQTPSLHSGGSITSAEPGEDPAVLRLRQYAISMDSPQEANQLILLSRWPSTPGENPANFSWKPAVQTSTADDEADYRREQRRRREETRRRRRTEKFLNEDIGGGFGPASQPAPLVSYGSHPDIARHAPSSQVIDEFPMTQPGRGMFGSRSAEVTKKKQRRRNAGF